MPSKDSRSALTSYFAEIRQLKTMDRDEEQATARRAESGADEARNALVEANLSFVVRVAAEYRGLGVPFEDLVNEGNLGLIEAAARFDCDHGTKFITYATWWIRKTILSALGERAGVVRVPDHHRKIVRSIQLAKTQLRNDLGREPRLDEISDRLAEPRSKIERALVDNRIALSIDDEGTRDSDATLSDRLADRGVRCAENELIRSQLQSMARDAMESFTDRERFVLKHRFGLDGGEPLRLKDLGAMMGISRERVRQIELQATERLRRILSRRSRRRPRIA